VDVAEPVPVGSLVAALDVGAAGVVIDTDDELADAALLAELAERERHRLDEAPLMTVAICVYNATGDLDRCLASLRSLRYPRYEVLVCDDGSSDVRSPWANVTAPGRAGARPRVRWRHGPRGCAEAGASQLAAVWTVNEFARRSISA
jgi:hypothetical protein